ncbi:hypothetical protein [Rhodococcoides kyotonense]|uniref:Uncharacterized protein n=1 Tax=Rhodococcoides kyotonense TaxID=398843 RepID=A0A239EK08_9NOCA|nr:hypothetical protein [Rhodococcus kyotonensis]SNS44957.1 hypothetical protein SAMN05421642_102427 [Rhodococcus kyotonensis]
MHDEKTRDMFLRNAHRAAMERSIAAHLDRTGEGVERIPTLTLRDVRHESHTTTLLQRRSALGLSICPNSRIFVDEHGKPISLEQISLHL